MPTCHPPASAFFATAYGGSGSPANGMLRESSADAGRCPGALAGNGGTVKYGVNGGFVPQALKGRGIRFKPHDTETLEATSGGGQFGLTTDDYGRWFTATGSIVRPGKVDSCPGVIPETGVVVWRVCFPYKNRFA